MPGCSGQCGRSLSRERTTWTKLTLDRYAAPNENFGPGCAACHEPHNGLWRAERAKRYCQLAKGVPHRDIKGRPLASSLRHLFDIDDFLEWHVTLQDSEPASKRVHSGDRRARDDRIVVRGITPDEFRNQRRFVGCKEHAADVGRAVGSLPQRRLCARDGASTGGGHCGPLRDHALGDCNRTECEIERRLRTVAAPDVEYNRTESPSHRNFGTHPIRPKTIDRAFFEGLGRHDAEVRARTCRTRY